MMRRSLLCIAAALAFRTADAQPSVVALPAANATINDDFSAVSSIRELPDGRVLIADTREKRVVAADFDTGRITPLGRVGSGPGEYRSPRQLLALSPDTTLLLDTQQRRLIVIVGADSTVPFPVRDGLRITSFDYPFRGVDRSGRFVAYASIPNSYPGPVPASLQLPSESDSVLVIIAQIWRPETDTIARIEGRFRGRRDVSRSDGSRRVEYAIVNPLGVEEQVWMFPDGWLALVLSNPYRVDWLKPDGSRIHGAPLPYQRIKATHEEKVASIDRYGAKFPGLQLDASEYPGWPEFVPPFPNQALIALTDGRLAIARMATSKSTTQRYDIVDRTGKLTARLEVPVDSRIVAFGRESVYVVTRDEFDLEHVTRHALPRL